MNSKCRFPHRLLSGLLTFVMLCTLLPTAALAGQIDEYHDPAKQWMQSANRTKEFDVNAIVTHETFWCATCEKQADFTVWRVPEYTRDGQTAMNRGVQYSDGTCMDGVSKGNLNDGTPGLNTTYTSYHWTKSVCANCGAFNSNESDAAPYGWNKNLYILHTCDARFIEQLPETSTIEYVDDEYHKVTKTGGNYCVFCYGTNYVSSANLERHTLETEILPQPANNRFAVVDHCTQCEFKGYEYVTAKSVISDYYGVVDGQPHTITVTDLSDSGVRTDIRYGNSADTCNMTSAPNYTEEGQYTVYYAITYTYQNVEMTENGVAYVWLHDESSSGPGGSSCGCGCQDPSCGCKDPNCPGNCCPNQGCGCGCTLPNCNCQKPDCSGDCCGDQDCGENHNWILLDTVDPTCQSLGYDRYLCISCGTIEKRDYVDSLDHNWQGVVVREATCETDGKLMETCSRCSLVRVTALPKGEHQYKTWNETATCISPGYTVRECSVCGDRHIENVTEALPHNYIAHVTPPTCLEGGSTLYRCDGCGSSFVGDHTEALDHDWDDGTVITDPTCVDYGVTEYRCKRCNLTRLDKTASALENIHGIVHSNSIIQGNLLQNTTQNTVQSNLLSTSGTGHIAGSPATCTRPQTCTVCGAIMAEATGHRYSGDTTAPTCTTMGYTTRTCVNCGDTYKDNYTDPLGHNYRKDITAPTCTEAGFTTFTCTRCGDSYVSDYREATGHDWDRGTKVVDSTCNGAGMIEYRCRRCNMSRTETESASGHTPGAPADCTNPQLCTVCGAVLENAKGHDFTSETLAPTCTEMGYVTYTCKACDLSYRTDYIKPLGHAYRDEVTPATCLTMGYTTHTCSVCNDRYVSDTKDATGHHWDSGTTVVESTCGGSGMIEYRCTGCNELRLETVEAIGHIPGPAATCTNPQLCTTCGAVIANATGHDYSPEVTDPTCTEMGFTTYNCNFCDSTYQSKYTKPLGHDYDVQVTAPTCLEMGFSTYTCTRCGDNYIADHTEATGHNWDSGTKVVESTCNGSGMIEYRCTNCNELRLEAEDANGHTPGPAATCTAPQLCVVCGAVLENAIGHNYQLEITPPTCLEMGYSTYTCSNCDLTYRTDYTKPLGHNYLSEITDPTCLEMGYSTYTCSQCGDSYLADYTDALGHKWDEGTTAVNATCNGEGLIEYRCVRCNERRLETQEITDHTPGEAATCTEPQLCLDCGAILVKALGHDYKAEVTAPTCTQMGYTTNTCSRCKDTNKTDYVEATGHKISDWIVDVEPTMTAEGKRHKKCETCDEVLETSVMEKLYAQAITDTHGEAIVDGYLVTVTDTKTTNPIANAIVNLHQNGSISVSLPDGRLLDLASQTTIVVQKKKDKSAAPEIAVSVTDKNGNYSNGKTDRTGKFVVPIDTTTTNSDGKATVGYNDGTHPKTLTINVSYADTGRAVEGAVVSVSKTGGINITLPNGTDLDDNHRITVTVTDVNKNPQNDLTVVVKNDTGKSATGKTNKDGKITVPTTVSTYTETNGSALVNGYTVTVTDKEKAPVVKAQVTLQPSNNGGKDAFTVLLPTGKLLDANNQITVTVVKTDAKPAVGLNVKVMDSKDNRASKDTDSNGKVVVPTSTGSNGTVGINTGDQDTNNTLNVQITDQQNKPIDGVKTSIDKDGNVTVVLPNGFTFDKNGLVTVIVKDTKGQPKKDVSVSIKDGTGSLASGKSDTQGKVTLPATRTERHSAYILGFADGTFGPEKNMTRAQAAAIFARILSAKKGESIPATAATGFSDVPNDAWYAGYVKYLNRYNVVNGKTRDIFAPKDNITRAQFTAMAVRFFDAYGVGSETIMTQYNGYNDVSDGYWAAGYIEDAAVHGWIQGYSDGSFRGDDAITRAAVVTIMNRLLDREADTDYIDANQRKLVTFSDVSERHWAYDAILEAANMHTATISQGKETWNR